MRWRSGAAPRRLWNPWFAWHPIRTGFMWIWLETVDRRWLPAPADARWEEKGEWDYRPRKRRSRSSECDGTEYYR
jgi:hypothetical protein